MQNKAVVITNFSDWQVHHSELMLCKQVFLTLTDLYLKYETFLSRDANILYVRTAYKITVETPTFFPFMPSQSAAIQKLLFWILNINSSVMD